MFNSYPVFSYEVTPENRLQLHLCNKLDHHSLAWYKHLHSISTIFKDARLAPLLATILSFFDASSPQFPPDFVKCVRLYGILDILKPHQVIELGCGTSTSVISFYLSNTKHLACTAYTFDDNPDWLNLTYSKIYKSSSPDHRHHFINYIDSSTFSDINIDITNNRPVFFYLDASFDDSSTQGLKHLKTILSNTKSSFIVLIDSRMAAVANLHQIAVACAQNLYVHTTKCLVKNLKNDPFLKVMTDYTIVSNDSQLIDQLKSSFDQIYCSH